MAARRAHADWRPTEEPRLTTGGPLGECLRVRLDSSALEESESPRGEKSEEEMPASPLPLFSDDARLFQLLPLFSDGTLPHERSSASPSVHTLVCHTSFCSHLLFTPPARGGLPEPRADRLRARLVERRPATASQIDTRRTDTTH